MFRLSLLQKGHFGQIQVFLKCSFQRLTISLVLVSSFYPWPSLSPALLSFPELPDGLPELSWGQLKNSFSMVSSNFSKPRFLLLWLLKLQNFSKTLWYQSAVSGDLWANQAVQTPHPQPLLGPKRHDYNSYVPPYALIWWLLRFLCDFAFEKCV